MGSSEKGGSKGGRKCASNGSTTAAAGSPGSSGRAASSPSPGPTSKACTLCGKRKPLAAFRRKKAGPLGRASRCKVCMRPDDERSNRRKTESGRRRVAALTPEQAEKQRACQRRYIAKPEAQAKRRARLSTPEGKARRYLDVCRRRLRIAKTPKSRLHLAAKIREFEAYLAERRAKKRRRADAELTVEESLAFRARGGVD